MSGKNTLTAKLKAKMNAMLAKATGAYIVNLTVTTATGDILEFAEVAEGDMPKVGDKAMKEGVPVEGEVKIPTEDGKVIVYVFGTEDKKGELLEIKEETEGTETVDSLKAQLKEANDKLKAMTATQTETIKEMREFKAMLNSADLEDGKGDSPGKKDADKENITASAKERLEALKAKNKRI